ncbi:anaerobic dimethyl sulfoxide reductase chain A [Escherichia coli]|uniref:Anaerobic dimethyl sulfoxide reductase chain A n=1 Tax=Escherichia coli TaxID=562 RepID=A0A377F737_ECOLX|nr:anaerobic dimethyl sulfoxide reductase chain A [Escherichia coli]
MKIRRQTHWTTPSGKIEIYSQALADIAATWELPEGDVIEPLPIYTPGFESYQDPLNKQYPLQLTGSTINLAFTQLTATLMC